MRRKSLSRSGRDGYGSVVIVREEMNAIVRLEPSHRTRVLVAVTRSHKGLGLR
jgi:hypothetical protein